MPKFEVWIEGFNAQGNDERASFMGIYEADDFRGACIAWAAEKGDRAKDFDADRLTYWNCRMFDNEASAREFNG